MSVVQDLAKRKSNAPDSFTARAAQTLTDRPKSKDVQVRVEREPLRCTGEVSTFLFYIRVFLSPRTSCR